MAQALSTARHLSCANVRLRKLWTKSGAFFRSVTASAEHLGNRPQSKKRDSEIASKMAEHDSSEKSKILATVGKERKDGKSSAGLSVERPAKRAKLLDDSSSESNGEEEWNGVSSDGGNGAVSLKINEEYARRFEHNKKREERQRCKLDTGTAILLKLLMKFSGGKVR
jgi:hypothetical protein